MTEQEFAALFENEKTMYSAWGNFVTQTVMEKISATEDLDVFFKVKPASRVKEINSLITKAFYREKNYQDPYNDITDKVGTRFVVLLNRDIDKICKTIEISEDWVYSKDRDFDEERLKNPTIFGYQSDHYIVKSKHKFEYGDITINEGIPCEIQIRTLLQHAYSELTHDTIYKPKAIASPDVYRKVARSMALIETTDEIFTEVDKTFCMEKVSFDTTFDELDKLYKGLAKPEYERKLNTFIFDAYKDIVDSELLKEVTTFFSDSKELLKEIISNKYKQSLLYRQPIVIMLFYLITRRRSLVCKLWPLTQEQLKPLFIDLGIAFSC